MPADINSSIYFSLGAPGNKIPVVFDISRHAPRNPAVV
jgi:hypothetical protein